MSGQAQRSLGVSPACRSCYLSESLTIYDILMQVPLDNGTDDATFHRLFKPIMEKVVQVFQPGAIVLQCGAPQPVFSALCAAKSHVLCGH